MQSKLLSDKSRHLFAASLMLLGSFLGYQHLTKNMDQSSHLIKQTLFNIARNSEAIEVFGKNPKIVSRINGIMLQRKGVADIEFEIISENGCRLIIKMQSHNNL